MASHPSQPAITTYMFWIEPLEKIVAKELQVIHLNSICDTYNLEIGACQNLILASHPSQPLFTTYIISKIEYLDELFCETRQVTQVNHCLRRTYFGKLNIQRNNFARNGESPKSTNNCDIHVLDRVSRKNIYQRMESQPFKQRLRRIQFGKLELRESNSSKSPKSTTVYDIHNFKNRISRRIVLRDSTSHPSQPLFTTHIFSKIEHLEK